MEGGIIGLRASKDYWIFYVENSLPLLHLLFLLLLLSLPLLLLFDYSEDCYFRSFVLPMKKKKKKIAFVALIIFLILIRCCCLGLLLF